MRLCEIPAPPFGESARAAAFKQAFQGLGLTNVRIDRPATCSASGPGSRRVRTSCFSAHLDTVFPADTASRRSRVRIGAEGTGYWRRLPRPGGAARRRPRARHRQRFRPPAASRSSGRSAKRGSAICAGVKHLFEAGAEGAGGSASSRSTAPGSASPDTGGRQPALSGHVQGTRRPQLRRFRHREPGARARSRRRRHRRLPGAARASDDVQRRAGRRRDVRQCDCRRTHGWKSTCDPRIRPRSGRSMQAFRRAVDAALAEENARWDNRGRLTVEKALVGSRPGRTQSRQTRRSSSAAVSVTRALGRRTRVDEGSTDANIPISLGIPAITIGGGRVGERHPHDGGDVRHRPSHGRGPLERCFSRSRSPAESQERGGLRTNRLTIL